jgi:hypothetical protein
MLHRGMKTTFIEYRDLRMRRSSSPGISERFQVSVLGLKHNCTSISICLLQLLQTNIGISVVISGFNIEKFNPISG